MIKEWNQRLINLRASAKYRGLECNLTLEQYMQLASEAGITHPSQIGKTNESFQMARYGDVGNYEVGNCRFITKLENIREKTNRGLGRTKYSHRGIAAQAEKLSKSFKVKSPAGEVFEGSNLNEFCKLHGLTQTAMSAVCLGKRMQHKGWTGEYR